MTIESTTAQRERSERQRKLLQMTLADDVKWLMSDPRGRRLMWGWLSVFGVFRLSFTGQAPRTDFNEGQRNAGLYLMALVNDHAPDGYVTMQAEAIAAARGAHTSDRAA